jgi:hypothetical protein
MAIGELGAVEHRAYGMERWEPLGIVESREIFLDGYVWDCCERLMRETGRRSGPHRSDRAKRVRMQ